MYQLLVAEETRYWSAMFPTLEEANTEYERLSLDREVVALFLYHRSTTVKYSFFRV